MPMICRAWTTFGVAAMKRISSLSRIYVSLEKWTGRVSGDTHTTTHQHTPLPSTSCSSCLPQCDGAANEKGQQPNEPFHSMGHPLRSIHLFHSLNRLQRWNQFYLVQARRTVCFIPFRMNILEGIRQLGNH